MKRKEKGGKRQYAQRRPKVVRLARQAIGLLMRGLAQAPGRNANRQCIKCKPKVVQEKVQLRIGGRRELAREMQEIRRRWLSLDRVQAVDWKYCRLLGLQKTKKGIVSYDTLEIGLASRRRQAA